MRSRPEMLVLSLILTALVLLGCSAGKEVPVNSEAENGPCHWLDSQNLELVADLEMRDAAYVPTELDPDLSFLDDTQRQVLELLVQASKIMTEIFQEQATPCHDEMQAMLAGLEGPQWERARRYFRINLGPWDRRFHHEPWLGDQEHPEGANYYPAHLTDEEKAAISDPANGLDGLFTMVRRDEAGNLQAIPYSKFFGPRLTEAARLLKEAAALTENESLRAFLNARAEAFLSDDYYESDMLWMDLDSVVEVTIGPYETYEDGLFGFKAAFESFVTVTDPVESARLANFKHELPWLEAHLPIPDEHKNFERGGESPIRVVDEVYSAGDTRTAVQTIAFNLPNDERVREAKGSKKVLLRNVMKAKFNQILLPIAAELVADDQVGALTAESFFLHTLWHEMSHGLGPGKIVKDGRETEVRLELKDTYSTLEEAKADAMGEWDIFVLTRDGRDYFGENIFLEQSATYLAGLFRSVRFGIGEAHGAANAIQYNYLMERGAITYDRAAGKYRIHPETFEKAIDEMVGEICMIQALGDYAASKAFIERYGKMTPLLQESLDRLVGIPVDLEPVFPSFE